jgi:alanine dehydrogenase
MLSISAEKIREALDWPSMVAALEEMFRQQSHAPLRQHHITNNVDSLPATLLLMPAWTDSYVGVKVANIFPSNSARALPAVSASYVLSSGRTGEVLAIVEGGELTARRTAAASALATRFLARHDASRLLIVGTGRLSCNLALAHGSVRSIDEVLVWGRRLEQANRVVQELARAGLNASVAQDLEAAVASADIVSCATLSQLPLIRGEWLSPGSHLDLVGGFTPQMREADDLAIKRSTVFVDTRAGACLEAGDIVTPMKEGVLTSEEIQADLHELCRGQHPGRRSVDEITLFKSVGAALEDLAAAALVFERSTTGYHRGPGIGVHGVEVV